jgi:radical SAM superfamily enzyme YgiQ (UPF0313 family)
MTKKIAQIHRRILDAESGFSPIPDGEYKVLVVYPNVYRVAMSNLAFQWLYYATNSSDGVFAERLVLPDDELAEIYEKSGSHMRSIETSSPASDCSAWLTTVSFENDYVNLAEMIRSSGMEVFAESRSADDPLIVVGGPAVMLNPEPLSRIADVILLGEGDAALSPFIEKLVASSGKSDLLDMLADLPNAYVPRRGKKNVRIIREATIDGTKTHTHVVTVNTEFKETMLVEIYRGCPSRCRFCAAGHLFLPARSRTPSDIELPDHGQKSVGLVGPGVSGHPQIEAWIETAARSGRLGISSIRMETLTDRGLRSLADNGARSVALAPEAGSYRLRAACNKDIPDERIASEAARVVHAGFKNLKLYFMVGLPTETEEDLADIGRLVQKVRDEVFRVWKSQGAAGNISVSVNPFIPKAGTPFQWARFVTKSEYAKAKKTIGAQLKGLGAVNVKFEPYRAARLQALLSLGGAATGDLIAQLASGANLNAAEKSWSENSNELLHLEKPIHQELPWDFVETGIKRKYLEKEYERAMKGKLTPGCKDGCRICGICDQ